MLLVTGQYYNGVTRIELVYANRAVFSIEVIRVVAHGVQLQVDYDVLADFPAVVLEQSVERTVAE